ncbi:hypothetical protein [Rhizobium sp. CC-YZS058]|uniref:hypothetical protein n=1 Tax=Rhizobium sp. CC-YZS058 TaxID=3042153 RepID=UPI002B055776|nr:hypothetical protein [Rhizobium sp. CC-YZS058]
MSESKARLEHLSQRAREAAVTGTSPEVAALLLELAAALDEVQIQMDDVRREAFREGIRGAAKVIRNRQATPGSALGDMLSAANTDPDAFAVEVEKAGAKEPVTLNLLRKLRGKVNNATEGTDEIDEDLKTIYYSVMNDRNPTAADILPPGSPSRSLDVATFMIERMLRDGWWTLGNSGVNAGEKPVGKIGLNAQQSSKPHTAETTPLALISALLLTLIDTSKGR